MNELIKIFEFHGSRIRIDVDEDGDPWFCLKDVCEALGIVNSRNVASALDDDEKKIVHILDGNRGNPNLVFISESGFYEVVRRSRTPEAKAANRWVRKDVLPSIRKSGGYVTDQTAADPKRFLQSLPPDDMWAAIRSMVEDRTIAAEHMASIERQKRLESEESRRAADARTKGAIDDNAKLIHENRQLERAFDTARRETDSLARHGWKTKKILDELAEQLGIESKDLLAQHDAEDRVEKPSQGLSRGRSTHQQWVNNFYAPPPKKDGDDE